MAWEENVIDCVALQLQYDESVTTEGDALEVAESHYNDYMLPTIQRVLDEVEDQTLCIEEIDIDLGRLAPEDVPHRLETMLREAIERNRKSFADKRPLHFSTADKETTSGSLDVLDASSYHSQKQRLLDFLIREQLPWREEPAGFDAAKWWNTQVMNMLEHADLLRSLHSASEEPAAFHRLDTGQTLRKEETDIDLNRLAPEDVPHRLETMQREDIGRNRADKETTDGSQEVQNASPYHSPKQRLQDFLVREHLPWEEEPDSFDAAKWWDTQTMNMLEDADFLRSLHSACEEPAAFYRLATYSSGELLVQVLARWLADDELVPPTNVVKKALSSQGGLHDIKLLQERMKSLSPSLLRLLLMAMVRDEQMPSRELMDRILELTQEAMSPQEANESQKPNKSQAANELQTSGSIPLNEVAQVEASQLKLLLNEAYRNIAKGDYWTAYSEELVDGSLPTRYTTDVAGLVLLHPFLPHFFRRLQLIDEQDQFPDLDQRLHAVHLLRCMTDKPGRHQSHLLNLEKIVCGLSPMFPVPEKYEVSDEERQEILSLFEAVKQYWKTVADTSVEGIQQTFMHRTGVITYEEPYWVLRVEGSALDILMDDLPWELSLLMLPWAERSIWVEWQREN